MDLKKIAKLSRLSFSQDEEDILSEQLNKIVKSFDRIQSLDTKGIEPLVTPLFNTTPLREDQPSVEITTDDFIALAPEASGRLYKVPRVIG